MKIGILTFHTAHNYGAVLQAYALTRYIQSLGHDAEVIDYRAEFNTKRFAPKPLKSYFSIRELYSIIFRNAYQHPCSEAFSDFYKNYQTLSKVIYSKDNLYQVEDIYDRIVVGSDQIWNLACTIGDDAYFLPFVRHEDKKFAYAASFGITSVKIEERSKIKNYISSFNAISVREKEGVNIVRELTGKEAIPVIDPTLLLSKKEWAQIANYSRCPEHPYLLIYLMSEDMDLLHFAKLYAQFHHLKIAYISQRLFKRIRGLHLRDVTPNQWLGLFLNADTIVTNSFHGSVFGVNLKKNLFIKYIPRSIANSRMKNIIDDYQLDSHLLTEDNIRKTDFPPIDTKCVGEFLSINRERSYQFIQKQILG